MPTPPDKKPTGHLAIRMLAMPADTNVNGDIFGGWVVSHMDLAGASMARKHANTRVATVAIEKMVFFAPVHVGDFICCYTTLLKVGRTSMTVLVDTYATDGGENSSRRLVTEGMFTYVAVDEHGKPIPVNPLRYRLGTV